MRDATRWASQARNFFGVDLTLGDGERGNGERGDGARVHVLGVTAMVRVESPTDELLAAARAAATTLGGFDVLVARTKSVLVVSCTEARAELLVAAVAASIVLGPILAPDGALLGVKSARERLAACRSA